MKATWPLVLVSVLLGCASPALLRDDPSVCAKIAMQDAFITLYRTAPEFAAEDLNLKKTSFEFSELPDHLSEVEALFVYQDDPDTEIRFLRLAYSYDSEQTPRISTFNTGVARIIQVPVDGADHTRGRMEILSEEPYGPEE